MLHTDPKLELIAKKVLYKVNTNNLRPNDNTYGSVILVLMVISIILSVIRVIQECNKKKLFILDRQQKSNIMKQEINTLCIKKTWLNQIRLSRIIRQHMSRDDYKIVGEDLKRAIMDVGSNLTDDESLTLVEAANV